MSARRGWMVMAALMAGVALAQPFDTPPPVAPPRPLAIAPPAVATLDNGLRVVVARRTGLPLVTVQLLVRSGAERDPAGKGGLANLTGALLAKGTATRSAPAIAEAAEALGGTLDSGAGWDRTYVAITVATPMVAPALALVADVALHPRFAPAELERLRRQSIDALNVALAEPGTLAEVAAERAAFGAGTYGHAAGGTPASLARIRRADVAALHATTFRPDNATLIFAGDISPEDAQALARRAFGAWRRPAAPLAPASLVPAQPSVKAPVVIAMGSAGQAGVAFAMPSIARSAPDYYAGVVANALVGAAYSSRLNQEIRIRRGLTYGVGSALDARRAGGLFTIGAQTRNAAAPELIEVTLAELARAGAAPPPASEVEARRLSVIGSVSRRFETTDGLAGVIAGYEAYGIDVAEVTRVIGRLDAVTPDDVQAFVRKHLPPSGLSIVVAGEAPQFIEALRARYPEVVLVPQAEVDLARSDLRRTQGP
ncbi:MAG: pitrilysin family protein [Burkholderiales bacterium]